MPVMLPDTEGNATDPIIVNVGNPGLTPQQEAAALAGAVIGLPAFNPALASPTTVLAPNVTYAEYAANPTDPRLTTTYANYMASLLPPDSPTTPKAPSGPNITTGKPLTAEQWYQILINNPVYKYNMQRLEKKYELEQKGLRASYSGGGGGYTPNYAQQRAILREQTQNATDEMTRKNEEAMRLARERLGGGRSGTTAVTLESARAELESAIQDLLLSEKMQNAQWDEAQRAAAASGSSGNRQALLAVELEKLEFNYQGEKYSTLKQTGEMVMNLYWDPQTGLYRGPSGTEYAGLTLTQAATGLSGALQVGVTTQGLL